MGLVIELAIYAAIAAAIAFGAHKLWSGFTGQYVEQGKQIQIAADQPKIDAAEALAKQAQADRDTARTNLDACQAAAKTQSDMVELWQHRAQQNADAARAAKTVAAKEASARAPYIAELQAKAAAAPKLQSCEESLGAADKALTDALKIRRGAK